MYEGGSAGTAHRLCLDTSVSEGVWLLVVSSEEVSVYEGGSAGSAHKDRSVLGGVAIGGVGVVIVVGVGGRWRWNLRLCMRRS